MPDSHTAYIAFPSSPALRQLSRQFIANLESGNKAPQTELVTKIMLDFTDELLKVFLLDVIHLVKLSPFMERLIHSTVNTVRSTVHGVTKTVVHRLGNQQMAPLGQYIRGLMLSAPNAEGQLMPWVGFPIEDRLFRRVETVVAELKRGGSHQAQVPELIAILSEITDLAMNVYIVQPTELVKLGFILRKMADGGASVIGSAIHLLIRKVIPDLSEQQFADLADYMQHLLLLDPLRDADAPAQTTA